jgi:hypothetical protein
MMAFIFLLAPTVYAQLARQTQTATNINKVNNLNTLPSNLGAFGAGTNAINSFNPSTFSFLNSIRPVAPGQTRAQGQPFQIGGRDFRDIDYNVIDRRAEEG